MKPIETDVLIIGAGPAGAVAAADLHREGFRALVVEKQKFPRFVIGESLLPHTMDLLKEVGLLEAVEARGFIHKTGAVFKRGPEVCDFDFANQSGDGWKYTYHVPRAEFDQTIADEVASRGVEMLYGHGVAAVNFVNAHAEVTLEQPDGTAREVSTRFVLDCSGYGRVLPRLLKLEAPSKYPVRESLFTHITGDKRPAGRGEGKIWICMHPDGGWIWIIPFSNGKTSIGVVATPEFFARFPGPPEAQLRAIIMSEPNSAERLGDMQVVFPPHRITGFACSVTKLFGPQFALAGNATEFLDPIFSSGVTLAMESGLRAAQVTARQLRGEAVSWQADYADHVMQGVETFRSYVTAWYDDKLPTILFAAQRNPEIMRQICSVLAGYVWDKSNPYVAQADRALRALASISSAPLKSPSPVSVL
jgi:flavin-dependent dehydrogenase